MKKKVKGFLSEFLRGQLSDVFSYFVTIPALSLILGVCGTIWVKRTEILVGFYSGIQQANIPEIAKTVVGFVVPTLGFGVVAFFVITTPLWIFKSLKNKRKTNSALGKEIVKSQSVLNQFSFYLDEITRGKDISGLGIVFLNKIKAAPPFLGIDHSKYVLSPIVERTFTEYFGATNFKQANKEIIRGGISYRASHGDTAKSVAKKIYGTVKFASKIPHHIFANGSYYSLPFVDTDESRGLSSEEIAKIYSKADEGYIASTIKEMVKQYNLPEDEVLWLMEMIYRAAQMSKAA